MVWRKTSFEAAWNHAMSGDAKFGAHNRQHRSSDPRVGRHTNVNPPPANSGASIGKDCPHRKNSRGSSSSASSTDTRDSQGSNSASSAMTMVDHHPPLASIRAMGNPLPLELAEIEEPAGGPGQVLEKTAINSREGMLLVDEATHEDLKSTTTTSHSSPISSSSTSLAIPTGIATSATPSGPTTATATTMINGSASGNSLYVSAQTIEEQIRQVDKIVKDCDNSRKSLELISRRLDDLHDEVRRYREFLGHEKSRRDPALYKTSNVDRPSMYNDSICGTMSTLTAQLTQEWSDKLRTIQGALCIPQTPSTPVGSSKTLDGR